MRRRALSSTLFPYTTLFRSKRVVLVDDSIVRGTTSKKIVQMVRDCGAAEVHFRIASPPTAHSCFYGVDTPNRQDLLAHRMSVRSEEHTSELQSPMYLVCRLL